jgi:DNA-binding beta-propeller fold protein YncE
VAILVRSLRLAVCLSACLASTASADSIFWSSYTATGAIRTGPLGGGTAQPFLPGQSSPQGVALDPAGNRIFWTNYGGNTINVANLDGSGARPLFTETKPTGIAFDPATQKLYWTVYPNDSSGAVRVGNADGSGTPSSVVPSAPSAQNVVIDPGAGKLYWSSYAGFIIWSANLNGTGATPLFSGENYPTGLAIDTATNTLYWTNEFAGKIRSGNTTGTGAHDVYSSAGAVGGLALDPSAGRLYWGDAGGTIRSASSAGGSAQQTLFSGETTPWYVAILHAPQGTEAPIITGSGGLGQKLSCSSGGWASDYVAGFYYRAPRSFAYQWFRDGAAIDGAVANSYTPFASGNYTCRVTATNAGGSTEQTSPPVGIGSGTTAPPPKKAGKAKKVNAGYSYFFAWNTRTKRNKITIFKFSQMPKGAKLRLRCHGTGCRKFKATTFKLRRTSMNLVPRVKKLRLKPGAYVEVRITAQNRVGEVLRFRARGEKGGKATRLCLPVGAKHPRRKCG